MKNSIFRKTLILSLMGHLALFSIFSFSFGNKIPNTSFAPVNFWGKCGGLKLNSPSDTIRNGIKRLFINMPEVPKPRVCASYADLLNNYHLKPLATLPIAEEKEVFVKKAQNFKYYMRKKEPVIILHPVLPYDFTLYFKDRQIAHVELMFNMAIKGGNVVPEIKRKISSGNLEVDLLSMRYIEHYLFIQQSSFFPDAWRTVKIDLSAKND